MKEQDDLGHLFFFLLKIHKIGIIGLWIILKFYNS